MPINWNTAVIHIMLCCILAQMEAVGPFHCANLLDIERFQTVFKRLARGTADVMESILNHYVLLESSLSNRLTSDVEWATPALPSTVAGYLGRLDSSDRADRICHGLGASTPYVLSGEEYKQVQTLWADEYPAYLSLHRKFNAARRRSGRARQCASVSLWRSAEITPEEQKWQGMKPEVQVDRSCLFFAVSILFFVFPSFILYGPSFTLYVHTSYICPCQRYERVQYAGAFFRTARSQLNKKHDDANIKMDYRAPGDREIKQAYATIQSLFVHEAFPGGPSRYVLEGEWFRAVGTCPIAKTALIRKSASMPFNSSSRFVFVDACYERPVAIWPHDPLGDLPLGDPRKEWFDVIDRNQTATYD